MAASVEQIDLSKAGYSCEFSGSDEVDVANAKTFWKSILLMPPIESRLVSGDARQRMKVAEPGQQAVNITHQPVEYPEQLSACLSRARELDEMQRVVRCEEVNERREQQRQLLHQQRQVRIQTIIALVQTQQKEMMCGVYRGLPNDEEGRAGASMAVKESWQDDDAEECIRELDAFDEKMRAGRPPTPESRN